MSIHFISGKPGGGKTLYSLRLIIDELVHGDRPVITNVALRLPELNNYLQERYPRAYDIRFCERGLHLTDRVQIITEDDLSTFFTFRGNGVRLESVSSERWKRGDRPNYSIIRDTGVLYVLDEVHIAFNSRAWAETGAEVLYYLSQHRKIGDDVVCITQAVANVDKQFRSVAQDYTYIKNLSKQRAGMFRLPSVFTRSTYAQPARDTDKPMESGTFTLDASGLAACYDTAKGVGIHGRTGADTKARKKGVHWLWFVVGFPLLLWLLLHYVPLAFLSLTQPKAPASKSVLPHAKPSTSAEPTQELLSVTFPPIPTVMVVTQRVELPLTNQLYCTGYIPDFGTKEFIIYLSDGSTVNTKTGRVQTIEKTYVVVDGVRLNIKRANTILPPRASEPLPAVQEQDTESQPVEPRLPFGGVQVTPPIGGSH